MLILSNKRLLKADSASSNFIDFIKVIDSLHTRDSRLLYTTNKKHGKGFKLKVAFVLNEKKFSQDDYCDRIMDSVLANAAENDYNPDLINCRALTPEIKAETTPVVNGINGLNYTIISNKLIIKYTAKDNSKLETEIAFRLEEFTCGNRMIIEVKTV